MKNILLSVAIAILLVSCKEDTKEKIIDASKAVGAEVKESIDTVKINAEKAIDTTKIKAKELIVKGAEKVEESAKKVKEAAQKKD